MLIDLFKSLGETAGVTLLVILALVAGITILRIALIILYYGIGGNWFDF